MTINFENIVFEDALTIISYASAYPVTLELQKTESTTTRKRLNSGDLTPITKAFPNSEKDSSVKSNKALFHPLFKSQSIEDVSSFRSTSPAVYSHIFDAIDATLEARRAKIAQYSPDSAKDPVEISKPKPLCSLEVIEETPQLLRRSPAIPRKLVEDMNSMNSSMSSLDARGLPDGVSRENSSATTITVTAEINAVDCKDEEETIIIEDPYAGLSYEERLQIIRLSYEDVDLSRSTPNSSRIRSESQTTTAIDDLSQKATDDFIKSPSPTLDSLLVSVEDALRRDKSFETGFSKPKENGVGKQCEINIHEEEAASAEDDMLSMGESPSSLESSTDQPMEHRVQFSVHSLPSKIRLNSLTSPSGSSIGASSESDRLSSPEQSKRDSGYDGNANGGGSAGEDEVEKAQYEKLLYFQRQLAKQHEELARLGIHVPMPATIQQPVEANSKHRPQNGQFTSA